MGDEVLPSKPWELQKNINYIYVYKLNFPVGTDMGESMI